MSSHELAGVYVAALTPLQTNYFPNLQDIPPLLEFYASRGCHGALLLGTTGEGPSFGFQERMAIFRAAKKIKLNYPDFRLLAGTGTPSLVETTDLNKEVFELDYDAVVVLPPYYYQRASEDGLFAWFQAVIERSVPEDKTLLYYHIPQITGVHVKIDLFERLKSKYPQFGGLKDSSGNVKFAEKLGQTFGNELLVLTGNDRLLTTALENQASGCITALANLCSPNLRTIWEAYQNDEMENDPELKAEIKSIQAQLEAWRTVLEKYQPFAPTLKSFMTRFFDQFGEWTVRPPLMPLDGKEAEAAADDFVQATFDYSSLRTILGQR